MYFNTPSAKYKHARASDDFFRKHRKVLFSIPSLEELSTPCDENKSVLVEDDNSLSYVDNFIEPPCVPVYPSSLPTCAVSKLPYDRNITDTSQHITLLDIARPCDKRKSVLGTDDNKLSYVENFTEHPDIPVSPSSLFTDVSKVHYDGNMS